MPKQTRYTNEQISSPFNPQHNMHLDHKQGKMLVDTLEAIDTLFINGEGPSRPSQATAVPTTQSSDRRPAARNDLHHYENTGPSFRYDAIPDRKRTSGVFVTYQRRTDSGRLEPFGLKSPDARPPVPPHAPRPPAPTSTLHAAPPPSELAHEPQVLAYPRGRTGSSSMPAAAPEEIAGASRFQGWSHHWRGLMSDAADGVIL